MYNGNEGLHSFQQMQMCFSEVLLDKARASTISILASNMTLNFLTCFTNGVMLREGAAMIKILSQLLSAFHQLTKMISVVSGLIGNQSALDSSFEFI